jgi:hypothetical protein
MCNLPKQKSGLRARLYCPETTSKGIDAGLVGELMMQAVEKRFGSKGKPPKTI